MSTQAGSFSTLMVALALFGLAGSAMMATIPRFFVGPARPDFTVFLVSGVAVILALILAATLAYRAFDEVERRAVRLGDATLLA